MPQSRRHPGRKAVSLRIVGSPSGPSCTTSVANQRAGFTPEVLDQLARHPIVAGIQRNNGTITIELSNQTETAPLVNIVVNAGAQVEEVHKSKANLEDVFLSLMEAEEN